MADVGGGVRKCWNCGQPTTDNDLRVCNDPICGQAAIHARESLREKRNVKTLNLPRDQGKYRGRYHGRYREYQREYDKRPEVKAKALERQQRPENKAKAREYKQRPEVKAKQREYMRKYRERNKKSSLSAEDHTIDDLDDESLMIRMENLAERMDAIVQRIGSYPDAERDPEYLRLVEQHIAYARVLASRHGFGAEDGSDSGCYNPDHWDCDNCFKVCLDCHPENIGGPHPESGVDLCMSCSAHFMAGKEPCECGSTRRCIECVQCFGCQVEIHEGGDYGMVCNGCAPKYFDADSNPVSSVAAGTTDALNNFANSRDNDDKFYFIGGLVGGLAIAVLGNIISDRLQDVYFPHWWDNRGGSSS